MKAAGRSLRGRGCGQSWSLRDDATAGLLALLRVRSQGRPCGRLEDFANTLVGLGRTLEVFDGIDLLPDVFGLLLSDGLLGSLVELLDRLRVVSEIRLAAHEDDGQILTEVQNLGDPLLLHVVQRIRGVDGKADQDHMGIGV